MEITEVRIKLMEESEDRLRAFCSITIDHCFVIRDLKIIEGTNGPFVAMPSRKLTGKCGKCGYKNHLRCNYCNHCGTRLRGANEPRDVEGAPNKLYADIAHPIRQSCRDVIQNAVVKEYEEELNRAKLPGYVSRYDDDYVEAAEGTSEDPSHSSAEARGIGSGPHSLSPPHFDVQENKSSRPHQGTETPPKSDRRGGNEGFGAGILDSDK